MPKRNSKESSDSINKTSTQPARDFQHGAVTRIEAKQVNKSNNKTLKSIIKKPIEETTSKNKNTTTKKSKPQAQLNGQYWKRVKENKAKVRVKVDKRTAIETSNEESSESDESMSIESEAEVSELSPSETTQTESEADDEIKTKRVKRVKFHNDKTDVENTKYVELAQQFQQQSQQLQQQFQNQFQQQQQQLLVLKDLLYQERDKVHDCETIIEK